MKHTSPSLDEKLRYHRMRAAGDVSSWDEYRKLYAQRRRLKGPTRPSDSVENISLDKYEPPEHDGELSC